MSKNSVFISYRRVDTNWLAVALRHHLKKAFPSTEIFMDVTSIQGGEDFDTAINQTIDTCDVLLAVIGPNWLTVSDNLGRRRLDLKEDPVRCELLRALDKGVRVIPVLVDGAEVPPANGLPGRLQGLARKQAFDVAHASYERDFGALCDCLEAEHGYVRAALEDKADTFLMEQVSRETSDGGVAVNEVADALEEAGVDWKTLRHVANLKFESGKFLIENAILERAIQIARRDGGTIEDIQDMRCNLAVCHVNRGRFDTAAPLFDALHAEWEPVNGAGDFRVIIALHGRVRCALETGEIDRAKAHKQALVKSREFLKREYTAGITLTLAQLADADGDDRTADDLIADAKSLATVFGTAHPVPLRIARYLARRVPGTYTPE